MARREITSPVGLRLPVYASGAVEMEGGADAILDYVVKAEEADCYDTLWVIDHLLVAPALYATSWFDPLELLAAIGVRTQSIGIGTAILVVPLWHPVLLAKRISTLDYLVPGRFTLGIGVGWAESEFNSVDVPKSERGARTDESMELMKQLWSGEPVSYDGTYYQVEDVQIEPACQPRPDVWVAGGTLTHAEGTGDEPRMHPNVLDRILRHEGWIARSSGSDAEDVKNDWDYVQEECRKRDIDPPTFAATQFVHIIDSHEETAILDEQLAAFHQVMGTTRTLEDLRASYLMGTIDDIQARVAELRGAGLEYLVINPILPDVEQIDLIKQHIVPVMEG